MKPCILLIEDDQDMRDLVAGHLEHTGFDVQKAEDGIKGQALALQYAPDLILLDLMLPKVDGLTLCQRLRRDERTAGIPILMITALGGIKDKVTGFNSGADDYITKPFDFEELMARINSVYRRSTRQLDSFLRHGNLHYDLANKVVKLNDKRLALSASESKLLIAFLSNPNRILNEDQLKDYLYGVNEDVSSNALNVHLFNLRKKVGKNIIVTERGLGFRLASIEEQSQ